MNLTTITSLLTNNHWHLRTDAGPALLPDGSRSYNLREGLLCLGTWIRQSLQDAEAEARDAARVRGARLRRMFTEEGPR